MPSFLTKVFGRKKDGESSPGLKSATGELLDGKFEDVSPTISPAAAHFPELQTNGSPRGRGADRTISESKLRTFFRSKSRSRAASPVRQQRKLEELPQLPLSLVANLNQDEAEVLLSDSVIGERKLTPVEAVGLVKVCSQAINNHGVDTLGIMNPHWYSASPEVQRRLISLFIQSLTARSPLSALPSFDSEINSTKSPHDVAAVLRWGLRHLQLQGDTFGHKEDWYQTFFDTERNAEYPPKAFSDKLAPLIPSEHLALLKEVLEVFSTLAAHGEGNSTSGSKLSKIFGLWLLNTHRVDTKDDWKSFYDRWELAGRQLEHIFFARIRDEAVEKRMPTRLVDLVRKYPFYKDNASPTTDLRLLPRSPLSTRVHDALLVRVETEVPTDKSRPKSKVHPVRILAEALSSVAEGGELSNLWSTISEASKREDSGTPLSRILSDETVRLLSLLPDEDSPNEQSPAHSLLPLSASSPRMKRNSFSLSEFTEELRRTHSTQSTVSPHSPVSADWSLFSATGFGASPTLTPLSSALFSPDLERTAPPSRRPSRHNKDSSTASTAPRKSVDFAPAAFPSTIAEEQRVSSTSKITSLQIVQLDESFIDFCSDALLDPVSSNWPSFVVCRLNPDVAPHLKYGPAEEGLPEKTLQWLVVEQQFTVQRPSVPAPAPVPASEESVQAPPARPVSPQSIGKKRFSFWTSSRSTSSNSITSTKSKRKDLLKGQKVGEMGEVLEEGEHQSSGTRSRRRSKAEDVVRVRIPSPKPRKSGDVRSLQSVDVGSPTVVKKPVPKAEETKGGEGESSGVGNVVAAAGAAVVAGTAAPALAAAASVIAVPVAAVAAIAAIANATTDAAKEGEPEPSERKEEEEAKPVEDGTGASEDRPVEAKDETVVVVLDDKVSDPEVDEPKPVVPEEVLVIPATAIAETESIVDEGHAPSRTTDQSTAADDSVEAKLQDKAMKEVVAGEGEAVPAEVQSPPDPEPVSETTIPVAEVAVPVIKGEAVVGSIPAVVEEVAEDDHVNSIPAIAPAPEEEARAATIEVDTPAVPFAEDGIKSEDVEVAGEPAVPGMPVQDFEPAAEESVGAASLDVAPTPVAEVEAETSEDPVRVEEKGDHDVANGHAADASGASPPIDATPSDKDAVEQSVANEEMSAPIPEPEVIPVQEEDVATAQEAVVAAVIEESAPVNTIIGNGSLKEGLAHTEPEVPSVDETASSEPTSPEIPIIDHTVRDLPTDAPDTTAPPADEAKPEAMDTILESHLDTEHGTAALDTGLEVTAASTVNLDAEREAENPESSTLTKRESAAELDISISADNQASNAQPGVEEELEREHSGDTIASGVGAAHDSEAVGVPEDDINEIHSDLEEPTPSQAPEHPDTTQTAVTDAPPLDVNLNEPAPIQQETVHNEEQRAIDPVDSSLTNTIAEAAPSLFAEEMEQEGSAAGGVNVISSIPHVEPLKTGDEDTIDEGIDLPAVPLVDTEFTQASDESEHIIVPFDDEPDQDEQSEAVSLSETLEAQHLPPAIEHALEVGSTPSVEALLDAVQSGESAHGDDVDAKPTPPSIDVALAETFAGADDLPTAIETAFETGLAGDPEALLNAVQATLSATVFASGATSPSEEKKEDAAGPIAAADEEALESEAKDRSPDHEAEAKPLDTSPEEDSSQRDRDADVVTEGTPAAGEDGQFDPAVEDGMETPHDLTSNGEAPSEDAAISTAADSLEQEPVGQDRAADASATTEGQANEDAVLTEVALEVDGGDAIQDLPTDEAIIPIIEEKEAPAAGEALRSEEEASVVEQPPVGEPDPVLEHKQEAKEDSAVADDDAVAVEEPAAANEDIVDAGLESTLVQEKGEPAAEGGESLKGEEEPVKEEQLVLGENIPVSDEQVPVVVGEDVPPAGESLVAEGTQPALEVESVLAEEDKPASEDGEQLVDEENPGVEEAFPAIEDLAAAAEPLVDDKDEEPIAVAGQGVPVVEDEKQPVVEDVIPVVEEVVEGTKLGEGEYDIVEEEQAAHAKGASIAGKENPETEQEQHPLVVEESAPAVGQTAIPQDAVSHQEEHIPVAEEDAVATKEELPVATEELDVFEDEAPVVKGETPLAQEDTSAASQEVPIAEEDVPVAVEEEPVVLQAHGAEEATPASKEELPFVEAEEPAGDEGATNTEEEPDVANTKDASANASEGLAETKEPIEHAPPPGGVAPEGSPAMEEAQVSEAASAPSDDSPQSQPAAAPLTEAVSPAAIDKLSTPIVEEDDDPVGVDQPKPTNAPAVEEPMNTPNA